MPPIPRCVCGGDNSPALALRRRSSCSFSHSSSGRVHVHSLSPLSRVRYICDALLDGTGEPQREPASSSSAVLASEFLRHPLSGAQMLDAASASPEPEPEPSDGEREYRGSTSGGTGLRSGERGLPRIDEDEVCRRSAGEEGEKEEPISEAGEVGLRVVVAVL